MTHKTILLLLAASVVASAPSAAAQTAGGAGGSRVVQGVAQGQSPRATSRPSENERATPQGFSVVLVLGDMAVPASTQDNVPPAARRALADMKDFLPYKSYKLLDAQWSLCCGRTPGSGRLRGADGQEYDLVLSATVGSSPGAGNGGGPVSVRFLLTEAGDHSTLGAGREKSVAALEEEITTQRERVEALVKQQGQSSAEAQRVRARIDHLNQEMAQLRSRRRGYAADRPVMDASFRMDVGETVVVGTSRVKGGDTALIALLTAVPQKKTGSQQ
jgi:hypothetical protein